MPVVMLTHGGKASANRRCMSLQPNKQGVLQVSEQQQSTQYLLCWRHKPAQLKRLPSTLSGACAAAQVLPSCLTSSLSTTHLFPITPQPRAVSLVLYTSIKVEITAYRFQTRWSCVFRLLSYNGDIQNHLHMHAACDFSAASIKSTARPGRVSAGYLTCYAHEPLLGIVRPDPSEQGHIQHLQQP